MRTRPLPTLALLAATPAALAQNTPIDNPIIPTIPQDGVRIRLVPFAANLVAPNWAVAAPGFPDRLFVIDQVGLVYSYNLQSGARTTFLNIASRLVSLGVAGPGSFDERGLIGLAFHPDFATNGLLYTFESRPVSGTPDFTTLPVGTNANCHSVITEWHADMGRGGGNEIDMSSAREVLRIAKPQFNHNGGWMDFGPDGFLYIALGDGGQGDDAGPGHNPAIGNGQDLEAILGKIIRIDVNTRNSANGKYGIPPTNPFVNAPGLDEIYASGLRNPFRCSFDRAGGGGGNTLWCGDVGQNKIEEIDHIVAGGNYGWHVKEGTFLFDVNGNSPGFVYQDSPGSPPGLIDPIAQYDHDDGISILGGFVYRGGRIPALYGRYVFGDFGRTFTSPGRLFHLDASNHIHEFRYAGAPFAQKVLGFGADAGGNIYVLSNSGGVPSDSTGMVWRIDAACPADFDASGTLEPADVAAFVNLWMGSLATANLAADYDGNGSVQPADISVFVNDWFIALLTGGC